MKYATGIGYDILEDNVFVQLTVTTPDNVSFQRYNLIKGEMTPDELIKIDSFIQTYRNYKELTINTGLSLKVKKIFSEFENLLSDENKLLLELSSGI